MDPASRQATPAAIQHRDDALYCLGLPLSIFRKINTPQSRINRHPANVADRAAVYAWMRRHPVKGRTLTYWEIAHACGLRSHTPVVEAVNARRIATGSARRSSSRLP